MNNQQYNIELSALSFEELLELHDHIISGQLELDDYNIEKFTNYLENRVKQVCDLEICYEHNVGNP